MPHRRKRYNRPLPEGTVSARSGQPAVTTDSLVQELDKFKAEQYNDHRGGAVVDPLDGGIRDVQDIAQFMQSFSRTVEKLHLAEEDLGILRVEVTQLLKRLGVEIQPGLDLVSHFKQLYVAVDTLMHDPTVKERRKQLGNTTTTVKGTELTWSRS